MQISFLGFSQKISAQNGRRFLIRNEFIFVLNKWYYEWGYLENLSYEMGYEMSFLYLVCNLPTGIFADCRVQSLFQTDNDWSPIWQLIIIWTNTG